MRTPIDKTITMVFASHPHKDATRRWKAYLTFPAGAVAETMLPLRVVDGAGAPIEQGVFEFAGLSLAVEAGRAELSYSDFIRGKHETALWLHRPDQPPVPGGLTFE